MEMNWPHQPSSWSSFPAECAWYLFPGLLLHLIAFALSIPFLRHFFLSRGSARSMKTALVFHASLLGSAMLANGLWSCLVRGRFYWSTDYISDFSAFYPITQGVLDATFGDKAGSLNGISLASLNGIWMTFAILVWFTAFRISRRWNVPT